jgi:hypothetical protein
VDTATVLGVQQMRAPFLDDIRRSAGGEARNTAARHARSNHTSSDGAETCCSCGVRRSRCNRGCEGDTYRTASLTGTLAMPPRALFPLLSPTDDDDLEDDDPDDEDQEVEEDEEDDDDEEVWQVRLT